MAAPPYSITPRVLALVAELERLAGRAQGLAVQAPQPLLRKRNRVRTIQGSVALEGNTLSEEQVTAVLDGKRVLADRRELLEITNASAAYELLGVLRGDRRLELLRAHRQLMNGLVEDPGRLRRRNVGIMRGHQVSHIAPPHQQVPRLVEELLRWLRNTDAHPLIKACVAHYELLFIHPFSDGNGRLARLWQQVVAMESSEVYRFAPVESVIRERQQAYYRALSRCDRAGDSTAFVELMLTALRDALAEFLREVRPRPATPEDRLAAARAQFGRAWFSRADYLACVKTVSTATASRDLFQGVEVGLLERTGERRLARYRFKRST